ncbi:hypothetical protein GE061_009682 [Apolygus lucorum]|uniref:Uncharacterized protein n=1 Tax=Apolygus lucorum TaxID=248454 RepID=A0A8S9Y172_APOLU|nr:hypothetical protein GE061_009682 [Apolygus lucorum]
MVPKIKGKKKKQDSPDGSEDERGQFDDRAKDVGGRAEGEMDITYKDPSRQQQDGVNGAKSRDASAHEDKPSEFRGFANLDFPDCTTDLDNVLADILFEGFPQYPPCSDACCTNGVFKHFR